MKTKKIVRLLARKYEDYDDCLSAAADDYIYDDPKLKGWDLSPRWEGGEEGEREYILLEVPE